MQLPTIVWNSDSDDPVTKGGIQIPEHVPSVVQARAEIPSQSTDTFTRRFSSSQSPPLTDGELASSATCESQILPRLDFDRLQPKPIALKRPCLRTILSVVVVVVAAIAAFLFGQRSLAGGQSTVEWLTASIGVGEFGGPRTHQEINGGSKNSGAISSIIDVQSDRDRTDNNMGDAASMPLSVATKPQPNIQPDEAQGNEVISAALASVQSGTLRLQRAVADGAPDTCGGKSGEGDLTPLPKLNGAEASAATYNPGEYLALAQIGRSWRPRMWLHWRWLNTPSRANKSHSGGESATASARVMNAASHSTN